MISLQRLLVEHAERGTEGESFPGLASVIRQRELLTRRGGSRASQRAVNEATFPRAST